MTEQQDGEIPDWDLADRMRKSLRHAGMTPGQMAVYLGVGGNTVSTWINGRIEPSFQTLRLWSLRTGVDLERLLERAAAGRAGPGGERVGGVVGRGGGVGGVVGGGADGGDSRRRELRDRPGVRPAATRQAPAMTREAA